MSFGAKSSVKIPQIIDQSRNETIERCRHIFCLSFDFDRVIRALRTGLIQCFYYLLIYLLCTNNIFGLYIVLQWKVQLRSSNLFSVVIEIVIRVDHDFAECDVKDWTFPEILTRSI